MKQFDLYLFDFDGTLVDTYDSLTYVFQNAYKEIGVEISRSDVARLMRSSLEAGYESVHGPDDEESKRIYGQMIIKLLDDKETLRLSRAYDEVKEVLTTLKERGHKIGIVTSNSKHHVIEVLEFLGFKAEMFDVIIGNGETPKRKPFPEPVLTALDILGEAKELSCYVGDALDDMRCGELAGVTPILVDRYMEYDNSSYIKIRTLDELIK